MTRDQVHRAACVVAVVAGAFAAAAILAFGQRTPAALIPLALVLVAAVVIHATAPR